ncbi:MBL fold metallo-hydrolase [Derxia gummosa]|uniref:MBL fold metallo-hydrolase n=1 Tax=Derxia gummosa DSM 723 TaxID=1121388 RepID=A0A8B6X4N3_9BURK|nr:MBL fold metallo-hydrolase [Derxia gummosa]
MSHAALDYPFSEPPPPATLQQVAPGIHWLRMPLPVALDHINLWLIEDEFEGRQGWTVVDTGIGNDATRALWEEVFAGWFDGHPLLRVICTHMHPDHAGLAGWLCERWKAPLWMSAAEYLTAYAASHGVRLNDGASMVEHFRTHGLPASDHETIRDRGGFYASHVTPLPGSYRRLVAGEASRLGGHDWRVIVGLGHSPEHVSLYCAGLDVLIAGDMLLPRISANVTVPAWEPMSNPLADYLDGLRAFLALPASMKVLPSHGLPFTGAHGRVNDLIEHHAQRLDETRAACVADPGGITATGLVPILFRRKLDMHQMTFALGEALAHLHWLWFAGEVERVQTDGVWRFRALNG